MLLFPPPTSKADPIAIRLHDHCAIYAPPPTPTCYAIHHTILVMEISCKGQPWLGEASMDRTVVGCKIPRKENSPMF